jgi:hypothetical protein
MHALVVSLAILVAGVAVESDLTWREKKAERELAASVGGIDRFVDVGVELRTVVTDRTHGTKLLRKCPPMRVVNVQRFGGIVDTADARPYVCRRSENPVVWYTSVEAAPIVLHADSEPLAELVHGSEGAGKTTVLAQWHYFRWLENMGEGRWGGQFAPTLKRLGLVRREIEALWPEAWRRYVVRRDFEGFELCDGNEASRTKIMFQSTHKASTTAGSPVQGSNLAWTAEDEKQDMVQRHADIMSRGRSAEDGRTKRIGTATAKDDSEWRELRDVLMTSGKWKRHDLSIYRTPFVDLAFLDEVLPTIPKREALRRYGDPKTGKVGDLAPELAVYNGWNRARNLTANPRIATDVTPAILAGLESYVQPGARFSLLGTLDPGIIFNTSEIAKLLVYPRVLTFRPRNKEHPQYGETRLHLVPTWVVVGELQTKQTTAQQHAKQFREKLADEFHVERGGAKAAIFADPHGKGEGDTDYSTVYGAFQAELLDVFNPAPVTPATPTGRITRSQRVDMMNRLLGGVLEDWVEVVDDVEYSVPRLMVALDEDRRVVAPELVKAFESLKKTPGDKNAEGTHVKDERDKTHAPASIAYGLWPFEKASMTVHTVEQAIAEARRIGVLA